MPATLLSNVTRRASQLWRNGSRRHSSVGGRHTVLGSTDNLDAVPLEEIAASPTPTPSPSPTPSSPSLPSSTREHIPGNYENPFENPRTPSALVVLSPFADAHQVDTARMRTKPDKLESRAEGKRHSQLPPPPMPLDLPRPKTPPPIAISTPPYLIDPPRTTHHPKEDDTKSTRWWHEWLCGCGEGPDRGGDSQACLNFFLFFWMLVAESGVGRQAVPIPLSELFVSYSIFFRAKSSCCNGHNVN